MKTMSTCIVCLPWFYSILFELIWFDLICFAQGFQGKQKRHESETALFIYLSHILTHKDTLCLMKQPIAACGCRKQWQQQQLRQQIRSTQVGKFSMRKLPLSPLANYTLLGPLLLFPLLCLTIHIRITTSSSSSSSPSSNPSLGLNLQIGSNSNSSTREHVYHNYNSSWK